ncbi:hypothetical protein V4C53_17670 [Paraburkholderia azotifigens]|uniref:hypothetical protein n=1 Tax=Paraburkholderia azotifigens TaxID=2057004 RepID=UPI00316CFE69
MVSSVGYGTASTPSTHRASVSADASAEAAQDAAVSMQKEAKQDAAAKPAQPGVTVSISPEGAAAASRVQRAESADRVESVNSKSNTAADDTGLDADTDTDTDADTADIDATDDVDAGNDATPANVSPMKAFAYGALGLERPDQPQDERNSFYSAGKWLAAGLTIGGIISLLV